MEPKERIRSYRVDEFPWKILTGTVFLTAIVLGSFGFLIHSLPDAAQRLRDEQKEFILARGRILQLDEILTMSARMGAATTSHPMRQPPVTNP